MFEIPADIISAMGWTIFHSLWQFSLIYFIYFLMGKRFNLIFLSLCLFSFIITFIFCYNGLENIVLHTNETNNYDYTGNNISSNNSTDIIIDSNFSFFSFVINLINYYSSWITLLWLVGIIFFSLRFFSHFIFLKNIRKIGVEYNQSFYEQLLRLKRKVGVNQKVDILLSSIVEQPMTFGFFKPIILIPVGLVNQLSLEEAEAIILHEILHIRENDYLRNIIISLIEVLLFYHPVIWWITNEERKYREEFCDDNVVHYFKDSVVYAQGLLKVKQFLLFNNQKNILAMKATGNSSHFSERIKRILIGEESVGQKRGKNRPVIIYTFSLVFSLLLFTSMVISKSKVVSVSVDKMNVFYIGLKNPITVAASDVSPDEISVTSPDDIVRIEPIKNQNGKYNVFIELKDKYQPTVEINIKGADNLFETRIFRLRRVPMPVLYLETSDGRLIDGRGPITPDDFRKIIKITPKTYYLYDEECEIISFETTRVPLKEDPQRCKNQGAEFGEVTKRLVSSYTQNKDVYYIDNIMAKLPGTEGTTKLNPMVVRVEN